MFLGTGNKNPTHSSTSFLWSRPDGGPDLAGHRGAVTDTTSSRCSSSGFFQYNSSSVSVSTQALHYQPPQMFGLALASQAVSLKPSFRQPSESAHKSQNHRLDWAGGDLRDHLVPTPFHEQEHVSLDQIALGQEEGPIFTLSFSSPTSDGTFV